MTTKNATADQTLPIQEGLGCALPTASRVALGSYILMTFSVAALGRTLGVTSLLRPVISGSSRPSSLQCTGQVDVSSTFASETFVLDRPTSADELSLTILFFRFRSLSFSLFLHCY